MLSALAALTALAVRWLVPGRPPLPVARCARPEAHTGHRAGGDAAPYWCDGHDDTTP